MKKIIIFLLAIFNFTVVFAQDSKISAFFNEYNKSVISSHKKLTLMYKKNNLSKIGKETASGFKSGTLFYNAKVKGFSGVVVMEYKNYSDFEDFVLNGNTNTKANVSANGKMFGTVICTDSSGKFLGSVCYDNIKIHKANAAGGFYIVTLADGTSGNLMWNEVESEKIESDDSYGEDNKSYEEGDDSETKNALEELLEEDDE